MVSESSRDRVKHRNIHRECLRNENRVSAGCRFDWGSMLTDCLSNPGEVNEKELEDRQRRLRRRGATQQRCALIDAVGFPVGAGHGERQTSKGEPPPGST
jgi:hypothetical protein